jgi:hypothetical protein
MPGDVVFMAGSAPLVWLTLKVALRTRNTHSKKWLHPLALPAGT